MGQACSRDGQSALHLNNTYGLVPLSQPVQTDTGISLRRVERIRPLSTGLQAIRLSLAPRNTPGSRETRLEAENTCAREVCFATTSDVQIVNVKAINAEKSGIEI